MYLWGIMSKDGVSLNGRQQVIGHRSFNSTNSELPTRFFDPYFLQARCLQNNVVKKHKQNFTLRKGFHNLIFLHVHVSVLLIAVIVLTGCCVCPCYADLQTGDASAKCSITLTT